VLNQELVIRESPRSSRRTPPPPPSSRWTFPVQIPIGSTGRLIQDAVPAGTATMEDVNSWERNDQGRATRRTQRRQATLRDRSRWARRFLAAGEAPRRSLFTSVRGARRCRPPSSSPRSKPIFRPTHCGSPVHKFGQSLSCGRSRGPLPPAFRPEVAKRRRASPGSFAASLHMLALGHICMPFS